MEAFTALSLLQTWTHEVESGNRQRVNADAALSTIHCVRASNACPQIYCAPRRRVRSINGRLQAVSRSVRRLPLRMWQHRTHPGWLSAQTWQANSVLRMPAKRHGASNSQDAFYLVTWASPARRHQRRGPRLASALTALRASESLHHIGQARIPSCDTGECARIDAACVATFARQQQLVLAEFV
jgi:hypothetical protein